MAKGGLFEFVKQVRAEGRKVTWPTGHKTMLSMVAVFIMVTISCIFLYFADQLIAYFIRLVMGF